MLINNLTDKIKTNTLEDKYYICGSEQAKKLVLMGFEPICYESQHLYYIFYKSEVLMEFLQKGEAK